jgi:hypothetical protein
LSNCTKFLILVVSEQKPIIEKDDIDGFIFYSAATKEDLLQISVNKTSSSTPTYSSLVRAKGLGTAASRRGRMRMRLTTRRIPMRSHADEIASDTINLDQPFTPHPLVSSSAVVSSTLFEFV